MAHPKINTRSLDQNGPSDRYAAVMPDDGQDLPGGLTRALFVGTAGEIVVEDRYGATVSFRSAASQYHPIRAIRVHASGTTAEGIVALY
jgi:hypothetical protein